MTSFSCPTESSAPINSLPPELIYSILRHGRDSQTVYERAQPFAYITSLVCRGWRNYSQALLWEDVRLIQEREARHGATGRYRTKRLSIHRSATQATVQSVLEGVRGLVELDLVNQSSLGDPLNLESDNLSDLKSLHLLSSHLAISSLTSFFRLESIAVIDSPFIPSFDTSSLRSFEFQGRHVPYTQIKMFQNSAAQLRRLVLSSALVPPCSTA